VALDDRRDTEGKSRFKELALLLGIREEEAADGSLRGRLALISRLKAARRTETARGKAGSWLYDVNRHLTLCEALRIERKALAMFLVQDEPADTGGCAPSAQTMPSDRPPASDAMPASDVPMASSSWQSSALAPWRRPSQTGSI
jgi:hypothetical protein